MVYCARIEMLLNYALLMLIAALIGRGVDARVPCNPIQIPPLYVKESMPNGSVIEMSFIICEGSWLTAFDLRFSSEDKTPACEQFSFWIKDQLCYPTGKFKMGCSSVIVITVVATQLDYERAELRECRRELIASNLEDFAIVRVILENEVTELLSPS